MVGIELEIMTFSSKKKKKKPYRIKRGVASQT